MSTCSVARFSSPGAVVPFDDARETSVGLVEALLADGRPPPLIAFVAQRDASTDDPGKAGLHPMGCAGRFLRLKHRPAPLLLQGLTRIRLDEITQKFPYLKARIVRVDERSADGDEVDHLCVSLRATVKQLIRLQPELPPETDAFLDSVRTPGALADIVAANWNFTVEEKVKLLEASDVKDRVRKVLKVLSRHLDTFGGDELSGLASEKT